jgi:hypothetical protein
MNNWHLVNWPVTKNCRSIISDSTIALSLSLLKRNNFSLGVVCVMEALEFSTARAGCKRSAMAAVSEPSADRLSKIMAR